MAIAEPMALLRGHAALLALLPAYLMSQFFRSFLAVIAPEISADLGLDAAALGDLAALWFLAFALAQIPIGIALDRIGPRRTVAFCLVLAVLGSALLAVAPGIGIAMLAQILIGLGCAPILMAMLVVVSRAVAPAAFASVTSLLLGVGTAGTLLGATPMALATDLIGWRGAMALIAVLTLLALLPVLLLLRGPIGGAGEARHETFGAALRGVGAVLTIRALWPLLPLCFTSYAVLIAIRGLWAGPYLAEVHGLDTTGRGNILLVMALAMVVGPLLYAPAVRLIASEKRTVLGGNLVVLLAVLALAAWPAADLATATALLATIGLFGMSYGILMAHGRRFVPDRLLGRGVSLMNLFFIGGVAAMQFLSGRVVEQLQLAGAPPARTYAVLFAMLGLALAATLALYLVSRERR